VAAGVVVVLAAVGYQLFVKQTHVDPARMSALVITHPGVPVLAPRAKQSTVIPTSSSTYPTVVAQGKHQPDQTGSFVRTWQGSSSSASSSNAATILADLLPTDSLAATVRHQAVTRDLGPNAFSSSNFMLRSRFAVAGIPGSAGSVYVAQSGASAGKTAFAVVFRSGRVVITELAESGPGGLTRADVATLARSESSLLEQVEPGFSQQITTRPFGPSVWYGVGTLVLVGLIVLVPPFVRRRQAARHQARADRARYQYRARGRRKVRRHRSPDWSRPRR
jgi:hypothetical protein